MLAYVNYLSKRGAKKKGSQWLPFLFGGGGGI